MDRRPSDALIERFAEDLAPWDFGDARIGLAVSGGPDSLALLLLANAVLPDKVAVATVDHRLRPESAQEAKFVAQLCEELGVLHHTLTVEVEDGNLQSNARVARYLALGRWHDEEGLAAVLTAHHADDQAETLLMRLNRGSGMSGLAGIRPVGDIPGWGGQLLRPLLKWRKSELEELVKAAGIEPVRDPSNSDERFDRAKVRSFLDKQDWLNIDALAASAVHLEDAWRAIEWFAAEDFETQVQPDGDARGRAFRYYANVPRAIAIETICRIIGELGGMVSRGEAGRAFDRLWRGENASLGGVLAIPSFEEIEPVGVEMRVWRFAKEPPRNFG